MLAGIRNVQPRPSVGFKFHSVLVVNSAHLASIHSPAAERWLPIFWGLDYFKRSQADDRKNDWSMSAVNATNLPSAGNALNEFRAAMDSWQPDRADAAIAALAQHAPVDELFQLMVGYGCRDFRDIGHKAIYVANAFRTLECIGWQHAQPILRSLTFALQCRGGDADPSKNDLLPDRAERANAQLIPKVRKDWQLGAIDDGATRQLISQLSDADHQGSAQAVFDCLESGVAPQSIYDALFVASAEMLMRQPSIISLHAVTMTNALAYAYRRVSEPDLRLKLLFQNASFVAMFMDRAKQDSLSDNLWDSVSPSEPVTPVPEQVASILRDIGPNTPQAASQVLSLLQREPSAAAELFHGFRRQVFLKGTNPHDYKYSSAVLEDYHQISPAWRNQFASMIVYRLRGSGEADTNLLPRIRAAIG